MTSKCLFCGRENCPLELWKWNGTTTGRTQCSTPNLAHPLPRSVRENAARTLGTAAPPIDADYAMIERRLAAGLGDNWLEKLREIASRGTWYTGIDIHTKTAALIFEVPEDQVTPEMRARAKVINFSAVYPAALSRAFTFGDVVAHAAGAALSSCEPVEPAAVDRTAAIARHRAAYASLHPVGCRCVLCVLCANAVRLDGEPVPPFASREGIVDDDVKPRLSAPVVPRTADPSADGAKADPERPARPGASSKARRRG
jgi:hypothetical protein